MLMCAIILFCKSYIVRVCTYYKRKGRSLNLINQSIHWRVSSFFFLLSSKVSQMNIKLGRDLLKKKTFFYISFQFGTTIIVISFLIVSNNNKIYLQPLHGYVSIKYIDVFFLLTMVTFYTCARSRLEFLFIF